MLWLIQRQLKSKKAEVRRKAMEQLGRSPSVRALSTLRDALSDEDPEVRRLAAAVLGKLEDERRVDPLLSMLRDRDPEVVKSAIVALKRVPGERIVPVLMPLLRHGDGGVRGHAAQVLEQVGWKPGNQEEEIWFFAAKGHFSRLIPYGMAAVPALEAALNSNTSSLSVGAVEALGHIGDVRVLRPLVNALKSADPAVCVATVDALSRIGGPQVAEPLISALQHRNNQVRVAAVESLGRLRSPAAVEPIRALLKDPLWEVRREAAGALGRLRDRRAVGALAEALNDSDTDVREAIAMALGNIGDREAIRPLVLALRDSASGVRRMVAAALSRIDPSWNSAPETCAAAEELKVLLKNEDSTVRYYVSQFLTGLGGIDPGVVPAGTEDMLVSSPAKRRKLAVNLLETLLGDWDRDLRQAAAEALGRLGDSRAQPALLRAQADLDEGVRTAAAQAIQILAAGGEAGRTD